MFIHIESSGNHFVFITCYRNLKIFIVTKIKTTEFSNSFCCNIQLKQYGCDYSLIKKIILLCVICYILYIVCSKLKH